ncbi:hypothetical protein [Adonisia turfae]|uniref:Uncharacterized protein n=1 Tax=Adonisia turfae CCMR0081 TaxID=2292702 RepID=A0A6M0RGT0_9CYAN|nr:hypothetical protein [Adonisia turfae]NEZ55454.1 hypothetical protein [Adonisia turfae CCMR0081]
MKLSRQELELLEDIQSVMKESSINEDFLGRTGFSLDEMKIEVSTGNQLESQNEIQFILSLLNVFLSDYEWLPKREGKHLEKYSADKLMQKIEQVYKSTHQKTKQTLHKSWPFMITEEIIASLNLSSSALDSDELYFSFRISPVGDKRLYYVDSHRVLIGKSSDFNREVEHLIDFFSAILEHDINVEMIHTIYGYNALYFVKVQFADDFFSHLLGSRELLMNFMFLPHKLKKLSRKSYMGCLIVITFEDIARAIRALKNILEERIEQP